MSKTPLMISLLLGVLLAFNIADAAPDDENNPEVIRILQDAFAEEFAVEHDADLEDVLAETDREPVEVRVYDIRELLVEIPNFNNSPGISGLPTFTPPESSGGGVFGDGVQESQLSRAEIVDEITELIQNTVGRIDE